MSQNFSLTLSTPGSGTSAPSVVEGLSGGNTLDLIIANDFGYPLTFAGGANAASLVVQISSNIIDADGARALTVASPWSLSSYQAPTGSASAQYFTFNLSPPEEGVAFPDSGTVTLQLQDLEPCAPGSGVVIAQYHSRMAH